MYVLASLNITWVSFLIIFVLFYAGVYRFLTIQLSSNDEIISKPIIDIEAPSRAIVDDAESHENIISNPNPPKLANIGYLGRGYDIVKGNPIPTMKVTNDGDDGLN